MERRYTSPTLGEVLKYLVDVSGVMPRKAHDRKDDTEFDEVEAKSYHLPTWRTNDQCLAATAGD